MFCHLATWQWDQKNTQAIERGSCISSKVENKKHKIAREKHKIEKNSLWKWTGQREHINALELRAVLTSLRWRLERQKQTNVKFVHLVDSLVSLHALSRGRTSSKKLRRTLMRVNALLLATQSQAVWAYVHTKQNPADAPSRRPLKRKWHNAKATSWGSNRGRESKDA